MALPYRHPKEVIYQQKSSVGHRNAIIPPEWNIQYGKSELFETLRISSLVLTNIFIDKDPRRKAREP
jgi:hypothetical protein